jgi:hypothetical protein
MTGPDGDEEGIRGKKKRLEQLTGGARANNLGAPRFL